MIGLIIICVLVASFFIVVITMLCKVYSKDIIELEERLLIVEKRESETQRFIKDLADDFLDYKNNMMNKNKDNIDKIIKDIEKNQREFEKYVKFINLPEDLNIYGKDGEKEMACKKGRGGKKK